MNKIIKSMLAIAIMIVTTMVNAQNTKEIRQDRNQIRVDKAMLERDTKELATFKANTVALKTAIETNDLVKARTLKTTLVASMKREIAQTNGKVQRAKVEVVQSSKEKGTNRREGRRNRRQYTGSNDDKKDMARDRHNKRDDRRDKRDDERDLKELETRYNNQTALYNRMKAVSFSTITKEGKEDINEHIVKKFIATMVADIDETKEELKEDRREKREDKRERRDDSRERREKY